MNKIKIDKLYATQNNLKRIDQINDMVKHLLKDKKFIDCAPIEIKSPSNGTFILNNGHHRATAILLSGRDFLYPEEYVITYEPNYNRNIYGKLKDMWYVKNVFIQAKLKMFSKCIKSDTAYHANELRMFYDEIVSEIRNYFNVYKEIV